MPRLLITNPTGGGRGGVYLLDTETGEPKRISDRPSRGITRRPDGYYFVDVDGAIHHLDPASWTATRRTETGLNGCHDLRWFGGEFYLVASYGNQVVRLDPDLQPRDVFRVVDDPGDVCHANCLLQVNGELLLAIFTLSPGRREVKRHSHAWQTEGKILRLDWERKAFDVLYEPLAQPHSLFWHRGQLHVCESLTSRIARIHPESGKKEPLCRLHGFVRGLAHAEGKLYAGISHKRPKALSSLERLVEPWRRWCGIVELDPDTWRVRRRFPLPGSQVYDFLVLDPAGGTT